MYDEENMDKKCVLFMEYLHKKAQIISEYYITLIETIHWK